MRLLDIDKWQEIFHTLRKNKLRTFLTAFGVFWGIFMLMIMLGAGNGLENAVFEDFGNFASNSAFIWTRSTTMPYKGFPRGRRFYFTNDDMIALKRAVPEIDLLAPRLEAWGNDANNVVRGDKAGAFSIFGDYPEFNYIDPQKILAGRFINTIDIQERRKVAVIGTRVRDILFKEDEDPIGQYIKIKGIYWQVIGVFKPGSQAMSFGGDKEETIYLPFSSLQKAYNFGDIVHYFSVTADEGIPSSEVEESCLKFLAERKSIHPKDDQAFGHFNVEKEFNQMKGLFTGISVIMWFVGIGTLLAGTIGVSNIMLIIIRERTKEIGIQRALGATPFKIISQIIQESVFLTAMAGFIGLSIGISIIGLLEFGLNKLNAEMEMFRNPEVDLRVAVTALIVLIFSGLIAGFIPAKRAVSIKPIEAIRQEN
ncbi:MAG: ABC transporter permease [Bacteroidales bacterium]|nr:ABC transporter permease [Bacteroidales bacterium]